MPSHASHGDLLSSAEASGSWAGTRTGAQSSIVPLSAPNTPLHQRSFVSQQALQSPYGKRHARAQSHDFLMPSHATAERSFRDLFAAEQQRQGTEQTERTPLLRGRQSGESLAARSLSDGDFSPPRARPRLSAASGGQQRDWISSLKRKSANISDLLSGRTHSSAYLVANGEVEAVANGVDEEQLTKKTKRAKRGYDEEFRAELEGEGGNGVRQWYASFSALDWIHDLIKHSLRKRKLREKWKRMGLRGRIAHFWDGGSGWVLVTIIGIVTALIAYGIIQLEALLFDLKSGYCSTSVWRSKRQCCPASIPLPIAAYSAPTTCAAWRTWSEVSAGRGASGEGGPGDVWYLDYISFVLIAVCLATIASTMTIYLTASTSVYSSKDSASVPHPGFSPSFPSPSRRPSFYGTVDPSFAAPQPPLQKPKPRKTMYFAAGSGIPEIKVILSGFVLRGYLGTWTLVVKSVGLAFSVASGLSVGKEGPLVQVASCVGNIASRFFAKYDRNEAKRREIISAACAAGVAVSFGAPVGGTLFSLEEVSYFFPPKVMWRSFWCAMIAAMSLKLLDPFGSGKIVLFEVTYDRDWHYFELIGFIGLGILAGVYGAMFCKANIWWTKNIRNGTRIRSHPILEVALVTLLTVAISYFNPFTKMGGTEAVFELFSECHRKESFSGLCVSTPDLAWSVIKTVGFALVAKALLTVITFGLKIPAGIFIPTLVVGACAGRIAGLLVEIAHSGHPEAAIFASCRNLAENGPLPFGQACVLPGLWAMIGAVATLAAVTRTTVSLAVIMFELTGTVTYTMPVMLAILVAKTVADALEPRSIYDLVIEVADLPYLDAKADYVHEATPAEIADVHSPVIFLEEANTLASLRCALAELYSTGTASGFPIVAQMDGNIRMLGYIGAKELEHGLQIADASASTICSFRSLDAIRHGRPVDVSGHVTPSGAGGVDFSWLVDQAPLSVHQRSPMELIHEMFSKLGVRYLVVVDERGFHKGVIEKNRYLKYLAWLEKSQHNANDRDWLPESSTTV